MIKIKPLYSGPDSVGTMRLSVVLLLSVFEIFNIQASCPGNAFCKSTLDRNSCPTGYYYRENVKSHFCCPDCVKLQSRGRRCNESKDCAPGLECVEFSTGIKFCTDDPKQSCEYYKNNDPYWTVEQYWKPDCLPDGSFGPKQCKGGRLSGKCFCRNGKGKRIFGEYEWSKAENMTCECSRLMDSLRQMNLGVSLHCDDKGNFEELQCQDDVCWCSNERTGIPYTPVVPESMIRALPCYDKRHVGSKYLRQCESVAVYTDRVSKLLKTRGSGNVVLPNANCNYDGSYARVQYMGDKKYCVYKNNKRITDPFSGNADCNCAYDKFVAGTVKDKEFHLECELNGSYKGSQALGNKLFRVDSDGFPFFFEDIKENVKLANNKNEKT